MDKMTALILSIYKKWDNNDEYSRTRAVEIIEFYQKHKDEVNPYKGEEK